MSIDLLDIGDKAVSMLWHGLDEARACSVVAQLTAQTSDALGQSFVGDGYAPPDFVEEAVLGHQFALFANQQSQGIEVARIQLDRNIVTPELAVVRVQNEAVETEAASGHGVIMT